MPDESSVLAAAAGQVAERPETIETPAPAPVETPMETPAPANEPAPTEPPVDEPNVPRETSETPPVEGEPPVVEEEYGEAEFFTDLSQRSGLDISSLDQLDNDLQELRQLRQEREQWKNNPFEGYDPIVSQVAQASKNGMDVPTYLRAVNMDVSKLSGKEAMREQFLMDNPNIAKYPEYANSQFEKQYQQKFGILNKQFDDPEEAAEAQSQIKDAETTLQFEEQIAKDKLAAWQEEHSKVPESQPEPEVDYTAGRESYLSETQELVSNIDGWDIPIEGENTYTMAFDDNDRAAIQAKMENGIDTLKELVGIDLNTMQMDPEKFGSIVAMAHMVNKLSTGTGLKDYVLSQYNRQTLEAKETNPAEKEKLSGDAPAGDKESNVLKSAATRTQSLNRF